MIRTESLTKRFPGPKDGTAVLAVDKLDLSVDEGQVFGFLGPNGAGKTTTVEILEGYRERTAGEVRVLGHDPARREHALRQRIGIVLQSTGVDQFLTVHNPGAAGTFSSVIAMTKLKVAVISMLAVLGVAAPVAPSRLCSGCFWARRWARCSPSCSVSRHGCRTVPRCSVPLVRCCWYSAECHTSTRLPCWTLAMNFPQFIQGTQGKTRP